MLMFFACKCDFLFLRTIQWLFTTFRTNIQSFFIASNYYYGSPLPTCPAPSYSDLLSAPPHKHIPYMYTMVFHASLLLTMISIGLKCICPPLSSFDYQSSSLLLKFGQILSLLWCIPWIPNLYYQFLFCVSKTSCANLIRSIIRNPFPYSQRISG